jgi:hypothetical protein
MVRCGFSGRLHLPVLIGEAKLVLLHKGNGLTDAAFDRFTSARKGEGDENTGRI